MNELEFNEKMSGMDSLDIYDGRGTYDLYVCNKCGEYLVTSYKDKGITPFMIPCNKCKEPFNMMEHARSFSLADESVIYQEWRRPSWEEFQMMSDALKEHVLKGGLILDERKRNINGYIDQWDES